jgi:hypothetical protein
LKRTFFIGGSVNPQEAEFASFNSHWLPRAVKESQRFAHDANHIIRIKRGKERNEQ